MRDDVHVGPSDEPGERLEGLLSGIDADDAGLVDPPAGLWERIEAAVRAEAAGTVPSAGVGGSGGVVEYVVGPDDVVVSVGRGWDDFAAANQGPELAGAGGTGRPLWDSIGDPALADLWRAALGRVRTLGGDVVLPFRCDGPASRRWYEMELAALPDGGVRFSSRLVVELERPEVPLLRRDVERDPAAAPVLVCCWCADASADGTEWLPVEELLARDRLLEREPAPELRQVVCGRCVERTADQLARHDAGA